MSALRCPSCGTVNDPDTTSGSCARCGELLPVATSLTEKPRPPREPEPDITSEPRPRRIRRIQRHDTPPLRRPTNLPRRPPSPVVGLLLCLFFLAGAVGLVVVVWNFPALGMQEWLGLGAGVGLLVVAYTVALFTTLLPGLRASWVKRGVWLALIAVLGLLPVLPVLAGWLVPGVGLLLQAQGQRSLIAQVRPLLEGPAPEPPAKPAVRGKVLIWDVKANAPRRQAQEKLPAPLQAHPGDTPLTIVAITDIQREEAQKYTSGEVGYRQTATVRVVYWPEGKLLGSYTIKGQDPPFITFRDNNREPILGDLDAPLVKWVQDLPREDSPEYQELLAEEQLADSVRGLLKDVPPARGAPPPLQGKVLIWDFQTNQRSSAQGQLPPELQGRSTDNPLTLVAILSYHDDKVTTYSSGQPGYRRQLTVALVTLPDRKRSDAFTVNGLPPPILVFNKTNDKEPVYGEVDTPLAEWIGHLPRAGRP